MSHPPLAGRRNLRGHRCKIQDALADLRIRTSAMGILLLSVVYIFSHASSRTECAWTAPSRARRPLLLGAAGSLMGSCTAQASGILPAPARGKISGGPLPLTVGLGTCLVSEPEARRQVADALEVGYRVIDTAQRYGNEAGVGKALQKAFAGGLDREEVFVTTKIWPTNYGFKAATKSVAKSAKELGLKYIDLVLPHWPGVATDVTSASENLRLRKETWRALEDLQQSGLVRQIGISNYNARHLLELLDYAKLRPSASQFEVHPFNSRSELVKLCQQEGIRVNAYSPLGGKGNPGQVTDSLLRDKSLNRIGKEHGKTAAQVILRWHLQRGITPIPKTVSQKRMAENYNVFDFELSAEEMLVVDSLDRRQFAVMDSEAFL